MYEEDFQLQLPSDTSSAANPVTAAPTRAETLRFALTDRPSGESDEQKAIKAEYLGRTYFDLLQKAQRGIDPSKDDNALRAEAVYFTQAMTGQDDVYGRLWKKGGFKTGREYLEKMHDFFLNGGEKNLTKELKEFQAKSYDEQVAEAMEKRGTLDALKHAVGYGASYALDWLHRADTDKLASEKALQEDIYKRQVRAEYAAKLLADNAWHELSAIMPTLSADGQVCAKALMDSKDNRLPEQMWAKFNNLEDQEKALICRVRTCLAPRVKGGFWNAVGDMGIGAANVAANVAAAPYRFANKLSMVKMNDWFDAGFDVNELAKRRQYLWQATGSFLAGGAEGGYLPQLQFEQICQEHGFLAESLIGAVSTLPYMAAASVPVIGVATVAMEAMGEMDDHVAMAGGDITDPDYMLTSALFGAMYAYTERLQVDGLLGAVGDRQLREAMLKGFWNGVKDRKAIRTLTAGTLAESLQEGLQNGIMAANEALALDQDATKAFAEGFTEDFINSLGTMLVVEGGGIGFAHWKRSGFNNPFSAAGREAGREARSVDLETEYEKNMSLDRMVEYSARSDELRGVMDAAEAHRLLGTWENGGKDALVKAGIDPVRAEEWDYFFSSTRNGVIQDEETGEDMPDLRWQNAQQDIQRYIAHEASLRTKKGEETDLAAFDLAMTNLDWVRSAWSQGAGIHRTDEEGKVQDPGAKALEALGFTKNVAARLSEYFHRERSAAYSPAALNGIKTRYESRMEGKVTAKAALAQQFGGQLVRFDGADYLQFVNKSGINLVRIDETPGGIDFSEPSEGVAVDVERATDGKVSKAQWLAATPEERRKIWNDYGLVHEGSFAPTPSIKVTLPADPSVGVDSAQAATIVGTISLDSQTDNRKIADTSAAFHEVYHAFSSFAQASGLWTKEDVAFLEKKFGKPKYSTETHDEEAAAEGFRSFLARRANGALTAEDERSPFTRIYAAAAGLDARAKEMSAQEAAANESEMAFFHQLIAEQNKPKPNPPAPKPNLPKTAAPQKGIKPGAENETNPPAGETKQGGAETKQGGAETEGSQPGAPKTWSAYTPTGNVKVSGHWAVLDLKDVVHSNNPLYAVHMRAQLRNRKDNKAEEDTRKDIVNNFQGERLLDAPDTANGAPIVFYDDDGTGVKRAFVLSGNGRVLVLNELADRHLYDHYRNVMKKWAAANGIEVPDGQTPILVRVIDDYGGASRDKVADLSNTNSIQQYTEEEQARADAEVIKALGLAKLYQANVDGTPDMTPGANDEFFSEFIRGVGDTSLYNSDRSLTQTARDRAQRALLAIAVGQGDRGRSVVKKLVEQTETLGIQRQKNAAAIMAAPVAALESNATYAIGPDVSRAMADFMDYAEKRRSGKVGTFKEYFDQMDLLDAPSHVARELLKLFGFDKSAATIAEYVKAYCKAAAMEDPAGGLFGAARTKDEIWNAAAKLVDDTIAKQQGVGQKPQRVNPAGGVRFSVDPAKVRPATKEEYDAALSTWGDMKIDAGNVEKAGWIFPDGRVLKPRMRTTPYGTFVHHDSLFAFLERPERSNEVEKFEYGYADSLAGGAVRLNLGNGGIEVMRLPTAEQLDTLYDALDAGYGLMEDEGEDVLRVDVDRENGAVAFTAQYRRGTSARRIMDDLREWFESAKVPDAAANARFSIAQTRTPEFKQWFGDWEKDPANASKVVDEEDKPLVVYRGAEFDPLAQEAGRGVIKPEAYFTADPNYAKRYAGSEGMVRAYYLNIRHPFDIRDPECLKDFEKIYPGQKLARGKSGALDWAEAATIDGEFLEENFPGKYDGIIFDEASDWVPDGNTPKWRGLSYVPLRGGVQVKSATDNIGAFDSSNSDIRFSIAGGVGAERMGIGGRAEAEIMEKTGAGREEIWRQTGWWRGKDGQWRVEIPDIKIRSAKEIKATIKQNGNSIQLEEIVDAPELFKAYPDLRETEIYLDPKDNSAKASYERVGDRISLYGSGQIKIAHLSKFERDAYDQNELMVKSDRFLNNWLETCDALEIKHGTFAEEREKAKANLKKLNQRVAKENRRRLKSIADDTADLRSTLAHEIQHWIQYREDFAKGGSPDTFREARELNKSLADEVANMMDKFGFKSWKNGLVNNGTLLEVAHAAWDRWPNSKFPFERQYADEIGGLKGKALLNKLDTADEIFAENARQAGYGYTPEEAYRSLSGEVEARNVQSRLGMTAEERAATPPWETEDIPENRQILRFSITPHGRNKVAGVVYPDAGGEIENIRFSIGAKRREEYGRILAKYRPDLRADAILEELDKYDNPKKEKITLHWLVRGTIWLPYDEYKIDEALAVAEKAKVDPFKYPSPLELIDEHKDIRPTEKRIDPDTVPELSDKRDESDGVVSYQVQDDRAGQAAMRRIIDTHWGEDANPWCLLARQHRDEQITPEFWDYMLKEHGGNQLEASRNFAASPKSWRAQYERETGKKATFIPDQLENAWEFWKNTYNALPKRVAFKNGKLLAFMATDGLDEETAFNDAAYGGGSKLAKMYPEEYKEYDKWTETEEGREEGANFYEWLNHNYPELSTNEGLRENTPEEWWDRKDESHTGPNALREIANPGVRYSVSSDLVDAMRRRAAEGDGQRYSINPNLRADIDRALAKRTDAMPKTRQMKRHDEIVFSDNLPFFDFLGLPNLRVVTDVVKVRKFKNKHHLSEDQIADLPNRYNAPVAVMRDGGHGYVLLTDMMADDDHKNMKPVMVYLRQKTMESGETLFIATAFAKNVEDEKGYYEPLIKGGLLFVDENKVAGLALEEETESILRTQASGDNVKSTKDFSKWTSTHSIPQTVAPAQGSRYSIGGIFTGTTADIEADARRAISASIADGGAKAANDALENYVAYFKLAHGPIPKPKTLARMGLSLGMNVVDPKRILKNAEKIAERSKGTVIESAAQNGDVATTMSLIKREKDISKKVENLIAKSVKLGGELTHKGVGQINSLLQRRIDSMMRGFTAASLADLQGDTGIDIATEIIENNPDAFETEYRRAKKAAGEDGDKGEEDSAKGQAAAPGISFDESTMSDADRYKHDQLLKEQAERVARFIEAAKARAEERGAKAAADRERRRTVEVGGGEEDGGGAEWNAQSSDKWNTAPKETKANFKTPEEFAAFLRVWARDKYAKTHGLKTLGQAEQDRLFAEFYRICVRKELQDLADKLLAPKMANDKGELVVNQRLAKIGNGARVWVNRRIADLEKGMRPDTIERASADIFAFINKAAIRVSRVDLITTFKKDLKERFLEGAHFDELKLDTERKLTGWLEEATRYIIRVCDLSRKSVNGDPSQLEQEYRALHDIIDKREKVYDESGRDVAEAAKEDAETRKAQWKLALLDKYGAMSSLMPGQILDLQNAAFEYLENEAVKLEEAWKETREDQDRVRRDFSAAIVGPGNQRYDEKKHTIGGWISNKFLDSLNGMIRLRLEHLTRFASPEARAKAKDAINSILVKLGDGEVAYARALQADREAFFSGLAEIFKREDGKPDNKAIKKYLKRMDEPIPVELSRQLSNQGFAESMTFGQMLQLLVSLEQRSFKDTVEENGREGQADLIRTFRYRDEDGNVVNAFTKEDDAFVDMLRAFYAAKRDQLSEVTERMVGQKVDSPDPLYCPIRRWMDDKARDLHADPTQRWDPISKIFSRRVPSLRDFDESRTIVGLFFENSKESAKLTAWAERGSFIRNVVTSVGFQASVKRAFGPGELSKILKQLEATFNGGEQRSQTPGEVAAADKAVNFVTYAYLGFNPLSALKQATSFSVWANQLPNGFKDLWRHMTHFDKAAWKHLKESDEYKVRYGNAVGSGMDYATKGINMNPGQNPVMRAISGAGMWMLKRGDFIPGGWIAQGVYKDLLDKHLKEGMAFDEADRQAITETFNMLEETQQSGRTYNTNMLQIEHGRIGRLLTQFATSPLQQLQYETQAWREWRDMVRYNMGKERIAEARAKLRRAVVINHVIIPAAVNLVVAMYKAAMGEEPPWEKDGYHWSLLIDLLLGQFSRVFFIGAFAQTTLNALLKRETPRMGQILPIEGALGMVASGAFLLHDLATMDIDKVQKDLERAMKSTAPTRIPYNLGRRILGDSDQDRKRKKQTSK